MWKILVIKFLRYNMHHAKIRIDFYETTRKRIQNRILAEFSIVQTSTENLAKGKKETTFLFFFRQIGIRKTTHSFLEVLNTAQPFNWQRILQMSPTTAM